MYTTSRTPSVSALNARMSGGSSDIQYTKGKDYTRKCMNSFCHSSRYLNPLFYLLSALSLEDDFEACANPDHIGNWMEWQNCIVSISVSIHIIFTNHTRDMPHHSMLLS